MDSLYNEFFDPSDEFQKEPRFFCYELARDLINKAKSDCKNWYKDKKTSKGILLLLFTWNFAARETKQLNFENVGEVLQRCESELKALENYTIKNMDEETQEKVKRIFSEFKKLMGQTGASKALSLLNPRLFVMWDTKIRKRLGKELIPGIKNGEKPEYYIIFLQGIQKIIDEYKLKEKVPSGTILAKKIDEYNYVRIVMNKAS
jgi:hypothetical protein